MTNTVSHIKKVLEREQKKRIILSESRNKDNTSKSRSDEKTIYINLDVLENKENTQSKQAISYLKQLFTNYPDQQRFKRGISYDINTNNGVVHIILLQSLVKPDKDAQVYLSLAPGKGRDSILGEGGSGKVKRSRKLFSLENDQLDIQKIQYVAKIASNKKKNIGAEKLVKHTEREVENTRNITKQKVYGPMTRDVIVEKPHPKTGEKMKLSKTSTMFFMPMAPGIPLSDFIDSMRHRYTSYGVEKIITNCLIGLQKIHQEGYVHMDIKSSNIMINPITFDVQFIDYDLSLKKGCELDSKCGTESYVAPEILIGELKSGEDQVKTDIFSLGVVLAELISKDIEKLFEARYLYIEYKNRWTSEQKVKLLEQNYNLSSLNNNIVSKDTIDMIKAMVSYDPKLRQFSLENRELIEKKALMKEFIDMQLARILKPSFFSKTILHDKHITKDKKNILQQARTDVDEASSMEDINKVMTILKNSQTLTTPRYSFLGFSESEVKIERPLNDLVNEMNQTFPYTNSTIKNTK